MNKYLTELIGTFFLVLTIGLTVLSGSPHAALAIGTSLMIMVYMGGHISGAHYNPAVSIAVFLRGSMDRKDLLPYISAQILGAILAAVVVKMIMGDSLAVAPSPDASTAAILLVEILFTYALALVVLNVATSPKTEGNSYYGLAIGFTITAAALAGGAISGGAFNPAVGIGPTIVRAMSGLGTWAHLWFYIVGPIIGGVLAAYTYKFQHAGE